MIQEYTIQELKERCFDAAIFPSEVLEWIAKENLWNLWIPKSYGGLELTLPEGLKTLKSLAKVDGSLGWCVTLCSGANYFIGNLQNEVAGEIFLQPENPVCFGGSGGVFGTAEKQGDAYKISGRWRYATGAPYLTHFTLNAKIMKNGKEVTKEDGSPSIRSFLVPRKHVSIIEDWNTMGLKATATHSFEVKDVLVNEKYSFVYNQVNLPQSIFRIHFSAFADLTLWVNYLGMAEHFLEEALAVLPEKKLRNLLQIISISTHEIDSFSEEIETALEGGSELTEELIEEIHKKASASVGKLTEAIIQVYPYLGIRATRENHPLNQIFRNYFTATQHHIFTRK